MTDPIMMYSNGNTKAHNEDFFFLSFTIYSYIQHEFDGYSEFNSFVHTIAPE